MVQDDKGFRYPVIDHENCINCGACDRVCAKANKPLAANSLPESFGLYAVDEELRRNSSSGGIFSLLARCILKQNGVVIGAAFSADYKEVHHIVVADETGLASLRGAKYLQSNMGDIFPKVKENLVAGKQVLFSGTPCQVAGLKAYLGKEYENLLCVDLVCHGVPSPAIWKKYCNELEDKFKGKLAKVNFRHKKYGWKRFGLGIEYNGQKIRFRAKEVDPYMRLFLRNYILRPSCYACQHKTLYRKSDITIADFWGVAQVAPTLHDGKGTSLVMLHNEKGKAYLNCIKEYVMLEKVDSLLAVKHNSAAIMAVSRPTNADNFWNEVTLHTVEDLADKYCPIAIKRKIKLAIAQSFWYKIIRGGQD